MHELRATLRRLRRTPAFTATAVLTIALGIGMTVTMLSVYGTIIRHELPVRDQERLVVLWTHRGDPRVEVSGSFQQLTQQFAPSARTLASVAGVAHWGTAPTPFIDGENAIVLNRTLVTGNYFEVLGATPAAGRLLRTDDPSTGAAQSMVISYGAWQRRFGGDDAVVGRTLHDAYGQRIYTIVGVAPPGLDYPTGVEAWTLPWSQQLTAFAVARLAPGASAVAARDEYAAIEKRLLPDWKLVGATATPFGDAVLGNSRTVLGILSVAVALLLLIACANVGNLLLLRAAARRHEIAIRRALGASVGDIARHLLLEIAVLGAMGGALGFVFSHALLRMFIQFAPAGTPRLDALGVSGVSFTLALGVALLATVVVGTFATLGLGLSGATSTMKFDSRSGTESRSRRTLRHSLVGAQIALALVVLAGAGLLTRSLQRLTQIELGYTPEHLAVLLVSWRTPDQSKLLQTGDALLERMRAVPGVQSATPILIPPFLGANVFHGLVVAEGQSPDDARRNPSAPLELGDAEYFRTFDIPIVRGRGFADADRENALHVAVVSEAMARALWPNDDPIGKRIRYWATDTLTWRTVVGVAGDIRFRSLRNATPTIYLPWRQTYSWQLTFAVRTAGSAPSTMNAIRRAVRAHDAGMNVWESRSMSEYLAGPMSQPRLGAFMLSGFGVFALLLAAIGLYGVMAFAVRDQTREIGVRMALGATPRRVRRDVLGRAALMTIAGLLAGIALALFASRFVSSLLFEIHPTDPIALVGSSALLLGVALVAAYIPARRATRIDPMHALRSE